MCFEFNSFVMDLTVLSSISNVKYDVNYTKNKIIIFQIFNATKNLELETQRWKSNNLDLGINYLVLITETWYYWNLVLLLLKLYYVLVIT